MKSVIEYLTERALSTKVVELIDMPELVAVAHDGTIKELEDLLDIGANPNILDNRYGASPLMFASIEKSILKIDMLIKYGADVNFPNYKGVTALMYGARQNDNVDTVKELLKLGADPLLKDNEGRTALFYAILAKDLNSVKVLAKLTPKIKANLEGYIADDKISTFLEEYYS